jgi:hypothetical protein
MFPLHSRRHDHQLVLTKPLLRDVLASGIHNDLTRSEEIICFVFTGCEEKKEELSVSAVIITCNQLSLCNRAHKPAIHTSSALETTKYYLNQRLQNTTYIRDYEILLTSETTKYYLHV